MGGAIFNMQGSLMITNSTIATNNALGGADNVPDHAKGIGGAVFNMSGTFTATGATFAGNKAAYFAAQIYNLVYDASKIRVAQTTLRDTIVSDGVGPVDLASNKTTYIIPSPQPARSIANADVSQFDVVRTMSAQEDGTISGSPLTADPLLGPLQNNGGPTPTMALGAGSPAIDVVSSGCLSTDQRGDPRPDNGESVCDIGAFEVQDSPPGGGGGTGGGKGLTAAVGRETLFPVAFRAAPSGPSAIAARRRYGTTVTYALNELASVRFTVVQFQPGRKGRGGRCVKPTKGNRRARKCTRLVTLRGSFTRTGRAGTNRFRFTGRVAGRKLKPGRYWLIATPIVGGRIGRAASAAFRIIR
jgi:hypothetical protein